MDIIPPNLLNIDHIHGNPKKSGGLMRLDMLLGIISLLKLLLNRFDLLKTVVKGEKVMGSKALLDTLKDSTNQISIYDAELESLGTEVAQLSHQIDERNTQTMALFNRRENLVAKLNFIIKRQQELSHEVMGRGLEFIINKMED
tara:strand:- start:44 stop:475 length:432 start_codon:yes stop_codon:yes gene_type:complete